MAIADQYLIPLCQHEDRQALRSVGFGCNLLDENQGVIADMSAPPVPAIHDLVQTDIAPIVIVILASGDWPPSPCEHATGMLRETHGNRSTKPAFALRALRASKIPAVNDN